MMKQTLSTILSLAFCLTLGFGPSRLRAGSPEVKESSLTYGKLGKMPVYIGSGALETLVLVLSGNDGWTSQLTDLSRVVAAPKVAVLGIDWPKLKMKLEASKSKCAYPAGDLETISRFAQTQLGFNEPKSPVLLGVGEGASVAYASHAQAPENTFSGVVSLDFCPRYQLNKSYCAGDALRSHRVKAENYEILPPPKGRTVPGWTAILTAAGRSHECAGQARSFVGGLSGAKLVAANGDGKTEALSATSEDVKTAPAAENVHPGQVEALKDLPLIVMEADADKPKADYFAVLYSGDGGWAGFDKQISKELNQRGVNVVGLSTLSYFWKNKPPEVATEDFKRILTTFKSKWGKSKVTLIGYSFGADVLPFLISRLPADLQSSIAQFTMISASGLAEFEFHISNWLSSEEKGQPVLPELEKLKGKVKVQCLYGSEEKDPFCPKLDTKNYSVTKMPGGHRFDGNTGALIDKIQEGVKK